MEIIHTTLEYLWEFRVWFLLVFMAVVGFCLPDLFKSNKND